jgi:hypothetical protein
MPPVVPVQTAIGADAMDSQRKESDRCLAQASSLERRSARQTVISSSGPVFFLLFLAACTRSVGDAIRDHGSLIATPNASTIYRSGITFFLSCHFSSSTAPQAFSRPDRKIETPARAGPVKDAHCTCAPLAGLSLRDRARRQTGLIGACVLPSLPRRLHAFSR